MSDLAKALASFHLEVPRDEPKYFLYRGQPRRMSGGDGTGLSMFDHPHLKFAARVKIGEPSECWIWTGAVAASGYGTLHHNYAHRLAWEYAQGHKIPNGMTIDHICWTRLCVNPSHLRLLTLSDNAKRQRRERKDVCKNGHDLTDPANLYRSSNQPRRRYCRKCLAIRQRAYYQRKRAAA